METPRVTEVTCRRRLRERDADAIDANRAINASTWVRVGGRDPLLDDEFDVGTVVAAFHDYPSDDLFAILDARCMA
jgi:hypothetical protein